MTDKLLTQQDVATRWKVSIQTVENYRKEGVLQPCAGIPVIRFTLQHILELEGVKLDRLSPLERKRLEKEKEKLERENAELKAILRNVLVETSKVIDKGVAI